MAGDAPAASPRLPMLLRLRALSRAGVGHDDQRGTTVTGRRRPSTGAWIFLKWIGASIIARAAPLLVSAGPVPLLAVELWNISGVEYAFLYGSFATSTKLAKSPADERNHGTPLLRVLRKA
jgi:hypothetical protein